MSHSKGLSLIVLSHLIGLLIPLEELLHIVVILASVIIIGVQLIFQVDFDILILLRTDILKLIQLVFELDLVVLGKRFGRCRNLFLVFLLFTDRLFPD